MSVTCKITNAHKGAVMVFVTLESILDAKVVGLGPFSHYDGIAPCALMNAYRP